MENKRKYGNVFKEAMGNVHDVLNFCTFVVAQDILVRLAVQIKAEDEHPVVMNHETMYYYFHNLKKLRSNLQQVKGELESHLKSVVKAKSDTPKWEDIKNGSQAWSKLENFPKECVDAWSLT